MDFNSLLKYLVKLNKNNTREWFEKNRNEYLSLKEYFQLFISETIDSFASLDTSIADVDAKKSLFRINRDIRFSKDKTPYKTNFGASIKEGGKKAISAGYYIHIEPGKSFLAGGIWLPEPPTLQLIRDAIDYDPEAIRNIVSTKKFTNYFKQLEGDRLKNPPKGFDSENPAIDFLKLKSFLMVHNMKDDEVIKKDFKKYIMVIFKEMIPLNNYLNKAISYRK